MRCVRSATCTFVEPVSDSLAPCWRTMSSLASFVRLISLLLVSPSNPSEADGKPRLRSPQGSSDLLEQKLADPASGDAQTDGAEERGIDNVYELVPADRTEH